MKNNKLAMGLRLALKRATTAPRALELIARADTLRCLGGWNVDLEKDDRRGFKAVSGMLETPRQKVVVTLTRLHTREKSRVVIKLFSISLAKNQRPAERWRKKFIIREAERTLWFSTSTFFSRVYDAAVEDDLRVFDQLAAHDTEVRAPSP